MGSNIPDTQKMESHIPAAETVNDQVFLEIQSLALQDYSIGEREMMTEVGTHDRREWKPVMCPVFKIDHHVLGDYIPSKVIVRQDRVHLLYYVNSDLPGLVRPFADSGMCYVWTIEWQPGRVYRYPALSRLFIDQVTVNGQVLCMFMAKPDVFESLLAVPERKIRLEGDLAVYNKVHRWA